MNTALQDEQPGNSSILNYPDFQTLPKGIKRMLLVSEAYFFDPPPFRHEEQQSAAQETKSGRVFRNFIDKIMDHGRRRARMAVPQSV